MVSSKNWPGPLTSWDSEALALSGRITPHRTRYDRTFPVDNPNARAVGLAA